MIEVHEQLKELIDMMSDGVPVYVPTTRNELASVRAKLCLSNIADASASINYIDFMFEKEKLGKVVFKPEAS